MISVMRSMNTFKVLKDQRLNAGFGACCKVSVSIEASFSWVDLDDVFQFLLAPFETTFPVFTLRFTLLK